MNRLIAKYYINVQKWVPAINRLKIISNFSGSAGLAIILKKKNYLFTDGRYTIQSHLESGCLLYTSDAADE